MLATRAPCLLATVDAGVLYALVCYAIWAPRGSDRRADRAPAMGCVACRRREFDRPIGQPLRTGFTLVALDLEASRRRPESGSSVRTLPERSASRSREAGSRGGSVPAMGCTARGVMREDLGGGNLERGTRAPTGFGRGHLRVFATTERALGPTPSGFPRGPRRRTAHADHGAIVRGSSGTREARPGGCSAPPPAREEAAERCRWQHRRPGWRSITRHNLSGAKRFV